MPSAAIRHRRLAAIAELVAPGSRVADIGSGRGTLPRLLLFSGRAAWCLATERTPAALARVAPVGPAHPLRACLALRHGDGFAPLAPSDRIDVVTITGLGARSIVRILGGAPAGALRGVRLVLQPQTEWPLLRRWLVSHGQRIAVERLVAEAGRRYLILASEPSLHPEPDGHATLDPDELLEAGPYLARSADPVVRSFWEQRLAEQRRIAADAPPGSALRAARQARLAARVLAALRAGADAPGSGRTDGE